MKLPLMRLGRGRKPEIGAGGLGTARLGNRRRREASPPTVTATDITDRKTAAVPPREG
jgi:hypothetical protein